VILVATGKKFGTENGGIFKNYLCVYHNVSCNITQELIKTN